MSAKAPPTAISNRLPPPEFAERDIALLLGGRTAAPPLAPSRASPNDLDLEWAEATVLPTLSRSKSLPVRVARHEYRPASSIIVVTGPDTEPKRKFVQAIDDTSGFVVVRHRKIFPGGTFAGVEFFQGGPWGFYKCEEKTLQAITDGKLLERKEEEGGCNELFYDSVIKVVVDGKIPVVDLGLEACRAAQQRNMAAVYIGVVSPMCDVLNELAAWSKTTPPEKLSRAIDDVNNMYGAIVPANETGIRIDAMFVLGDLKEEIKNFVLFAERFTTYASNKFK